MVVMQRGRVEVVTTVHTTRCSFHLTNERHTLITNCLLTFVSLRAILGLVQPSLLPSKTHNSTPGMLMARPSRSRS